MYKGHEPVRLVRRNAAATIPRITASVPLICPVTRRTMMISAKIVLTTLSAAPMFFVIVLLLSVDVEFENRSSGFN